ncbi:dihydropteroate synthase, partial [Lawsonibacter sp. DFI.6.74]|nr:dihydropteroate synthase [Lawsonibacter sp. DFI.6.74]
LLGTSRKSMIGKILDLEPKDRVEGTIATTVLGIKSGVDIVRVHDVLENIRAIKVADAICRR